MMETPSMESRVRQAMKSRLQHFRDQADSLTFEGVRRLLEKDMALDTHALDSHKKFVKQLLEKYLSGAEDEEDDKSKVLEQTELKEESVKEAKVEDSSVTDISSVKSETPDDTKNKTPNEDMIKEAIWNKATYFRSKSEELTLAGVRRLLEEDLELEKFSLDPFKKLISKQLDEVLNSQDNKDAESTPSHSENEDKKAKVKPKKKVVAKEKVKKSEGTQKRKKPAQETEQPKKKKIKKPEKLSVEKNNVEDQSSDEEASGGRSVKKEVVAPVYGKNVERLKSIIKACGMTVGPAVYKKAKQAPEGKREDVLIKELQAILSKEGLSANPSEKEIKDVKRRKERAKELEGIDTSNIVQGSRRRSTSLFPPPPPPKPKEPIESDSDDSEDEDDGSEDADGSEDDVNATKSGDDDQDEAGDDDKDEGGDDDKDEGGDDDKDEGGDDDQDEEDVKATQSGEEVHAETFDSD